MFKSNIQLFKSNIQNGNFRLNQTVKIIPLQGKKTTHRQPIQNSHSGHSTFNSTNNPVKTVVVDTTPTTAQTNQSLWTQHRQQHRQTIQNRRSGHSTFNSTDRTVVVDTTPTTAQSKKTVVLNSRSGDNTISNRHSRVQTANKKRKAASTELRPNTVTARN